MPKIIDFGLAKALESTQRLTDESMFTGIGQVVGTLKYMSPEQASLDLVDIDRDLNTQLSAIYVNELGEVVKHLDVGFRRQILADEPVNKPSFSENGRVFGQDGLFRPSGYLKTHRPRCYDSTCVQNKISIENWLIEPVLFAELLCILIFVSLYFSLVCCLCRKLQRSY